MGRLVLYPELCAEDTRLDGDRLLLALRDSGLIAAEDQDFTMSSAMAGPSAAVGTGIGQTHFAAGPRFMSLITFMGCMPFLVLDPEQGRRAGMDGFCHVQWSGFCDPPRLLATRYSEARYVCPGCGHRDTYPGLDQEALDGEGTREVWGVAWRGLDCPECGTALDASAVRWRRSGVITRQALLVWGVEPREAVPAAELLTVLQEASAGRPWDYCYLD